MGPLQLAIHLVSFAAPALVLAVLLALGGRLLMSKRPPAGVLWTWVAINFIAGLVVLTAGLWFFGRDGKMATYAVLVLAMATTQWSAMALRGRGRP